MADRGTTQSLKKGLIVLKALNEKDDISVLMLHQKTGIPRPTLYRLLNTLKELGYVTTGPKGDTYQLPILVRALSEGYSDEAWVTEIASPILEELGDEVIWPLDIGSLDRDAMIVRETTHQTSPLSLERGYSGRRGYPGYRVPILATAMGKAYLAFSSKEKRESILDVLRSPDSDERKAASKVDDLKKEFAQIRRRGYGVREGGLIPKTGSIAVPIIIEGEPLACLNLHYILSALTLKQVVSRYLSPMQAAAAKIEKQLTKEIRVR
ncbi:MAG: helix-turn-helix domain-containing protein [Rhodospirillaceae bacterium]|nr:helix-turn-helix domain-containing protein [Rhodospirillaceae bacterium]